MGWAPKINFGVLMRCLTTVFGDERGDHGRIPRRRSLALLLRHWLAPLTEHKVGLREATRRSLGGPRPYILLTSSCGNLVCRLHAARMLRVEKIPRH